MSVRIESMAEPLPGYRLIERLGGGGFGEVWKAEAPGGLFKAIKFVYGDLEAGDDEGARAGQEFKALQRVITVRHPFILSLERFDIIDGRLMIVTELADKTLWDRFRECRTEGLVGIPRAELLDYLDDTAEALDLMNTQYQLQHLDIKPQNLFLVHNHVKVADFGLVKDLEGVLASVTGGVTPVYAAPETFEGKVSRFSDQYSLAIVYQELLTGQRPYNGTTLRQLVMQHCQGTPDLKPLPEADRPVVLRSLSKSHLDRYPSCKAFVDALHVSGKKGTGPEIFLPADIAKADAGSQPAGTNTPVPQPEVNSQMLTRPPGPCAAPARVTQPAPVATPRPAHGSETPGSGSNGASTPASGTKSGSTHISVHARADGVLMPAIVIGLGQFGLATLRQLRKEIIEHFGSPTAMPAVRLLHIDTDPETAQLATRGKSQLALNSNEVVLTRLHRPSHYIKPRESQTGLESWLHPKMLYRIPRQQTAAGIRALGRLAFVDNYRTLGRRLHLELEECCSQDALTKTVRETGVHLHTAVPRVYIIANLAGGTGSGMFIDLAYLVQQQLSRLSHDTAEVVGLCYLPPVDRDARRMPELANTFAALTELNHFSMPHKTFSACYELGEVRGPDAVFQSKSPPFDRCRFFALPEERMLIATDPHGELTLPPALSATLGEAAHVIFADLAKPLGRAADAMRQPATDFTPQNTRTLGPRSTASSALFQMPGLYRLVWPRRQLLEQAASTICRRVVQRWMSKDARALKEAVKQWVGEKWEENGLPAEQLIGRYHEGCEKVLGQAPESAFQEIRNKVAEALQSLTGKPAAGTEPTLNVSAVVEAMAQLEQLVGIPEDCRPTPPRGEPSHYQPGTLETSLKEIAATVVDQYEQKIAELVVWLIEQPAYRLAGAEEALRQLHAGVEAALQAHEQLAVELQQRAASVYQRIHKVIESPDNGASPSASVWKHTFGRRPAGPSPIITDLLEMLRLFPKYRYQCMIMQHVTALYVSLRGLLSDQLREVDFCRARLGELQIIFGEGAESQKLASSAPAGGRYLFAENCKTLAEAVRKLEGSVGPQELIELDGRVQSMIRKNFRALVHVCMSSANVLKTLAPAMLKEARSFLRSRLGTTSVAEIYLAELGNSDSQQALDRLAEAFEQASPEVMASPPARQFNYLAIPEGEAELQLRELAQRVENCNSWLPVASTDEIVIFREHILGCLADLKQLGPLGQEAYQKVVQQEHFTPHSRNDILEWGAG